MRYIRYTIEFCGLRPLSEPATRDIYDIYPDGLMVRYTKKGSRVTSSRKFRVDPERVSALLKDMEIHVDGFSHLEDAVSSAMIVHDDGTKVRYDNSPVCLERFVFNAGGKA